MRRVHKYCNAWIPQQFFCRNPSFQSSKRMSNEFKSGTRNTIMKSWRVFSFHPRRHFLNQFHFNCISFSNHTQTFKRSWGVSRWRIKRGGEKSFHLSVKCKNEKISFWNFMKSAEGEAHVFCCFSREQVQKKYLINAQKLLISCALTKMIKTEIQQWNPHCSMIIKIKIH